MKNAIIRLENISKIYGKDDYKTVALKDINLEIFEGDFVSIMGPSGSGKTTLLNIIGFIDTPTDGKYFLKGQDVNKMARGKFHKLRGTEVSFIFQQFALLKDYTAYENIQLPLLYRKMSRKEKKAKILFYAEKLGIGDILHKKPSQLSGGQQQRVAIARALASEANIILADEPTGALDQKKGNELMKILAGLNKEGKTILVVTHDPNIANYCIRNIRIEDGKIISDSSSLQDEPLKTC
ncbi:MAG TPA: ABC transporter ATP-binding protein [Hungateiclostridium thermocellum]|jgi:putative ABC transport system ATP-binding protein|uniref:ABC transporter related protein n=2 Tax=Acetivibrio thermocellus TaxID=1515 RepID=A3DCE3_ACET2|nr:ABC transporter ATP-binding protein [Acetivibrio thermocellus]CDG35081.1 putative ABC transporter ATP-binding protein MJ1508 [Acetivibrio thermocellus BC1]ABN51622.1 ABC transporter related protein [Acetivibrio thermocellus ATCC 27405]ADU74892.1 ABC transporter related protein [Acetivibrio thermocellus DSM 1313]ALX08847.1 Phosphonate-transporting ATPase [Acetivibrio thermocellus AD2]ANV76597.1 Phosphonate-transporting ATPase [Acetivibrio thermocellus DSM 2360]